MKKLKSINWSTVLIILKACLVGIISTLVGVVVLAVVLKFSDLSTRYISYINDIVKIISLFIIVMIVSRKTEGKLVFKAIFAGIVYSLLSLVIFSALNGGIQINASIVYDLLFAIISSVIITVIVNLISRKTV